MRVDFVKSITRVAGCQNKFKSGCRLEPLSCYNSRMMTRPANHAQPALLRFQILLLIAAVSLLLIACAEHPAPILVDLGLVTPTPTPDLFASYRAALQPVAQAELESVGPLPRYHITAQLDESGDTLTGVMRVIVPSPGPELVFRLYPNLENYGGSLQITAARIDDTPVEATYLAGDTAVRLTRPPAAGETPPDSVTVDLAFTVQLSRNPESDYTLLAGTDRFSACPASTRPWPFSRAGRGFWTGRPATEMCFLMKRPCTSSIWPCPPKWSSPPVG